MKRRKKRTEKQRTKESRVFIFSSYEKKKKKKTDLYLDDPYVAAATKLYNWAVESNDAGRPFPIWGTCLGHQLLQIIVTKAHFGDILVETDAVVSFSLFFPLLLLLFFSPALLPSLLWLSHTSSPLR